MIRRYLRVPAFCGAGTRPGSVPPISEVLPVDTPRECGFDSRTGHVKEIRYCPLHGKPDIINAWPCPVSDDDEMCEHFEAELAHRIREVTDDGNYFELLPGRTEAGERMLQEYRNHQPHGEPQVLGHRYH
jgi:hypothetical protein